VLDAADCGELIEWLRHRPLLHHDAQAGWAMVHAGLHPHWTLYKAHKRAKSIAKRLRSQQWQQTINPLLKTPTSIPPQHKGDAFALAIFTRSRFCTADGVFNWRNNRADSNNNNEQPWFSHPHARWRVDTPDADHRNCRIVFGHWSAKGVINNQPHVLGLDSGCVWGNHLTLARIDQPQSPTKTQLFSIPCDRQC